MVKRNEQVAKVKEPKITKIKVKYAEQAKEEPEITKVKVKYVEQEKEPEVRTIAVKYINEK
jgi:hypothetical protein